MPHPSTSSAYGIWSLNEVRDAVRGDNWPTLVWTADLTNASYDSVSFSVSPQVGLPTGLRFNNDGTKMYVTDLSGEVVQYSLSTAFDISTASYSTVTDISAQEGNPQDVAFNVDGTKMYITGNTGSVYQYSLSTAFDLSTTSYDSVSFSVSSQTGAPKGFAFNNNGTKMYIVETATDSIFEYVLSTGFDLSTASYNSVSLSVNSQEATPQGIAFNTDGTQMFVIGNGGDEVNQYSLSTAFDLSTASFDSVTFSVSSEDVNPGGLAFSTDGTKMFVVGYGSDSVHQYSTGL